MLSFQFIISGLSFVINKSSLRIGSRIERGIRGNVEIGSYTCTEFRRTVQTLIVIRCACSLYPAHVYIIKTKPIMRRKSYCLHRIKSRTQSILKRKKYPFCLLWVTSLCLLSNTKEPFFYCV